MYYQDNENSENSDIEDQILEEMTENDWNIINTDNVLDIYDTLKEYYDSKGLIILNKTTVNSFMIFCKSMSSKYPEKNHIFLRYKLKRHDIIYLDNLDYHLLNMYDILIESAPLFFNNLTFDIFCEFIIKETDY